MKLTSRGFTLIEVLVAIVVLTIGIIALAGSSSSVTRMIGRGKIETRAARAASRRMEILRLAADAPLRGVHPEQMRRTQGKRCTDSGFASGGPVIAAGMTESWQVADTGKVRQVRVMVTYLTARGPRTAMLETRVAC